jgi:hypothetical protein
VDETGHSGDTAAADSGASGDSHDRTLLNGWATPNSPWSNAGAALDPPDDEVPSWRRPATEIRPFTRPPLNPESSGDVRPFGDQNPSGEVRPFGESLGSGEVPRSYPDSSAPGYREPIRPVFGDAGPSGEVRPFGDVATSGEARPFPGESRSGDIRPFGEVPQPGSPAGPSWSSGRARYSDLLAHLSPNGDQPEPQSADSPQPVSAPPQPRQSGLFRSGLLQSGPLQSGPPQSGPPQSGPASLERRAEILRPGAPQPAAPPPGFLSAGSLDATRDPLGPGTLRPGVQRPDSLQADDARRTSEMHIIDAQTPSSAPPYPYEGDLDDARREANQTPPVQTPAAQQRAALPLSRTFPAVRPATPGGRRVDWIASESARHALEPTSGEGLPHVDAATSADVKPATTEVGATRSSYDPSSFPRRLSYDPSAPAGSAAPADTSSGYASPSAYSGRLSGRPAGDPGAGPAEPVSRALPKRVPAEPDVPTVPEPPSVEPPAATPALARIATHLRRDDVLSAADRQEGFDVTAILAAVREVAGVRDASLRSTPQGAHSLRLDLAEGADPAEVSRHVARLLQDRMGLDAAMQGGSAPAQTPAPPPSAAPPAPATGSASVPAPPPTTPLVPTQQVPSGRQPVSGGPIGAQPGPLPQNPHAGRAADRLSAPVASAPPVAPPGPLSTSGPSYVAGPSTGSGTVEAVPAIDCGPPRPLEVGELPGPRVVIENVQVNTFGTEATVEVGLAVNGRTAVGAATGPAVDAYLLRLCAMATAHAVDELLSASDHVDGPARCFVEHAASVPFGAMEVAVVVLLLSCGGWVEQLAGSSVVTGDDRHAMVRATLAAVNRRLEALLS